MTGVVLGAAGASAALLACAVRAPCCTWLAPSYCRGPAASRRIALTFDDGPSERTPELLDILDRSGARATFFQCGAHARRLRSIVQEIFRAGHEIGNHTENHIAFYFKRTRALFDEIAGCQEAIGSVTGRAPVLFRPPYGVRWFGLGEAQRRANVTGILWSVLALDWKLPAKAIANRVMARAGNGAIVCLHDGRELRRNPDISNTISATRRIVPALQDRGFELVTVSELLWPRA